MIRLGVVGYGARINDVIRQMRSLEPDIHVVGIVDPDEKGARGRLADGDKADVRFYGSLAELVRKAKLDALAIGTRCNLHTPYAIKAAQYDLPLYLEKPVSTSMSQALQLERAFRKTRCEVVVSFPLRVSPLCVFARESIDSGTVGSAEHILAVNYVPYGTCYFDAPSYRNYEITQGLFLQKATHDLDYMSYLMDSPIVRVAAMAQWGRVYGGRKRAGLTCGKCNETRTCLESPRNRQRNGSGGAQESHLCTFGIDCGTPEKGMNEDASSALLEFASGAKGVYTQVFYSRRDSGARGATVSGYKGTISFDWYRNELKTVRHHQPFTDITKVSEGMSHFGGDGELALNFIDVIHGRAKSRTPIRTGLHSVFACLAAKESSLTGKFVKVHQVGV